MPARANFLSIATGGLQAGSQPVPCAARIILPSYAFVLFLTCELAHAPADGPVKPGKCICSRPVSL